MNQKEELEKAIAQDVPAPEPTADSEGFEQDAEPVDDYAPEPTPERSDSLISKLMSTEPNPPLEEVDLEVDTENGGIPRVIRGINKVTGGNLSPESPPAIFDILLGAYEEAKKRGVFDEVET